MQQLAAELYDANSLSNTKQKQPVSVLQVADNQRLEFPHQVGAEIHDMRETEVQWSFNGITTPLGVAAYNNIQENQKRLPTVEQLQERIKLLERELRQKK